MTLFPLLERTIHVTRPLFTAKATPELVKQAMLRADHVLRRRPIVLWDGYGEIGDVAHIACATDDPDAIDAYPVDETVFIYACTQDDLGGPFIRRVIARGGKFYPIRVHEPCLYVNIDTVARRALENELYRQVAEGFAKWDHGPHDFVNLIQALAVTEKLPGDYVEIGCYQGSSSGAVLHYLRDKGRPMTCHFLDVFEGFTYPAATESADTLWQNTHKTDGVEAIRRRLESYAEGSSNLRVHVHKSNCITDDLPADIQKIAVANIDVDLYEAVVAGLRRVAPLIVPGGIIVVEDPGHSPFLIGARVALDEFLESDAARAFTPILMQSGQTFLIRK